MIREAVLADVPQLVEMGRRFRAQTAYAAFVADNPAQMAQTASALIASDRGVVWVSEGKGGELTGMIGLVLAPHPMSGELMVGEAFWWSDLPGVGMRLFERGKKWAREQGAVLLQMTQPATEPRLMDVYAHLGLQPVETAWQMRLEPMADPIRVIDGAVPQPDDYRASALLCDFHSIPAGGACFHGMAEIGHSPLAAMLEAEFLSLHVTYEAFRLSPEGQDEPTFIHTDADMGTWSGILYLNPDPPAGDGTTFWKRRVTGALASPDVPRDEQPLEAVDWADRSLWEPWRTVEAVYNRLLLFPARYYHSRALFGNWGAGLDARLIQLVFGNGDYPCA